MNILHVNYTDLPGKRFNGYDLLGDLRPRGINGTQAVLTKLSRNPDVFTLMDGHADVSLHDAILRVEAHHCMQNLLVPWGRVLAHTPAFQNADVVHYHQIHNQMVSLFDLPRLFDSKPSVWTLHDPWPLTGHCIQPEDCPGWLTGCDPCPDLARPFSMRLDCAARMWRVKKSALASANVDIVVASQAMRDFVQRSPISSHFTRVHTVPFGIDASAFIPDSQQGASRTALGVPEGDFVIALRSASARMKGLCFALDALRSGPPRRPTTVLTVGERGLLRGLPSGYRVTDLGWIDDTALYARFLSASDVFLMPSTAEGFGFMALEAMAAGRPVICFEGTAVASVTRAPQCGVAVPLHRSDALRQAIDHLSAAPDEVATRGRLGRKIASSEYGHGAYLDNLAALYQRIIERTQNGSE